MVLLIMVGVLMVRVVIRVGTLFALLVTQHEWRELGRNIPPVGRRWWRAGWHHAMGRGDQRWRFHVGGRHRGSRQVKGKLLPRPLLLQQIHDGGTRHGPHLHFTREALNHRRARLGGYRRNNMQVTQTHFARRNRIR